MNRLEKVTTILSWKWVSYRLSSSILKSPHPAEFNPHNLRFFGRKATRHEYYLRAGENVVWEDVNKVKKSQALWKSARDILVEYLHSTRGLDFMDADLISRYSPRFLQKLWEKVLDSEPEERARSLVRLLRYHPINEFEPFFESIGLEPSEYVALLPQGFMNLSDEDHLLENYHVLCNYGIPRDMIGRIYKEAREVFGYDSGLLFSKLRALEGLEMSQIDVIKTISSRPHILIGNTYKEFGHMVEKMKTLGFQHSWINMNLPHNRIYNWRQIYKLLCLLSDLVSNREQVRSVISLHPDFLFEGSGSFTFSLIGFVLKLGFTRKDMSTMFVEFPKVQVTDFFSNLRGAFVFLNEMAMDPAEVESILRSHHAWLGQCYLLKSGTVLIYLGSSKKRASEVIKENPLVLKSWVRGLKVTKLPNLVKWDEAFLKEQKTNFLLSLGFTEENMADACKLFRGKGDKLQDRFNCLVNAGLNPEDVSKMVRIAPRILNLSVEIIQAKIDCLVNELGHPVSDLLSFPAYIAYATDRVRLRFAMYKWLCNQGIADPNLALSSYIACSEKIFIKTFVNSHPKGPDFWEELRKKTPGV